MHFSNNDVLKKDRKVDSVPKSKTTCAEIERYVLLSMNSISTDMRNVIFLNPK